MRFNLAQVKRVYSIYNVRRAMTPKVGQYELWCLCSARCLMVLNTCVNLHENISKDRHKYMTETIIYNVQRMKIF